MISCILLSAGLSSRFGSPKALAQLSNQTSAIQQLLKVLTATAVEQIIVVLGFKSDQILAHIPKDSKVQVTINKNFKKGQTASFKQGLSLLSDKSQGIMLLPVDYPFIQKKTINQLVDVFAKTKDSSVLIPTFSGRKGHPPVFHSSLVNFFLNLDDGQGINSVFLQTQSKIKYLPVSDPGVLATFNTSEELQELNNKFILD